MHFGIRISNFLFYLIILFLPTQLGKHFWPDFSHALGIRVDYLSPTLYLTDILIFMLFACWAINSFNAKELRFIPIKSGFKNYELRIKHLFFVGILIFLLTGISLSKSPMLGLYGFLKFLEMLFFGYYTSTHLGKTISYSFLIMLFSIGIFFESLLAIFQYIRQESLGGALYAVGERSFSQQTPGIANASIAGKLILRPYATFPHPNVLAGYLTIAMATITTNYKLQTTNLKKALHIAAIVIGSIALLLTLSRVAILLWLIYLGFIFTFKRNNMLKKGTYFAFIVMTAVLTFLFFSPLRFRFLHNVFLDESFIIRKELSQAAIRMILDNPIFGVGLSNFLVNLPAYQKNIAYVFLFQPVHNIYLLITAETGVVGFLFFVWFMVKTLKRIRGKKFMLHNSCFIILSIVLILGFFDHYFLTLQQGQLLFAFVFGLCFAKNTKLSRKFMLQ